jgi:glutamate:GABA antiporter
MAHAAETTPQPALKRELGFRDLVFFSVAGVIGTRWLAAAAQMGPSSVSLWVLAAAFFFIPSAFAIARLSARYPQQGGLYIWTRECFGEWQGFLCFWLYWVGLAFWFPSALIAFTSMSAYALGPRYVHLADHRAFVLTASLAALWTALGANILGLRFGKWLDNLGGFGAYVLGVILVAAAAILWLRRGPATPMTHFLPTLDWQHVNFWSQMAYALTGLELAPILGGEIHDPERNLPRSSLVAAPLVTVFYVIATLALLVILSPDSISPIHGVAQSAFHAGESLGVAWLSPLVAILIIMAAMGQLSVLGAAAARLPYAVGVNRLLPDVLAKLHPRWRTPYVSILLFGAVSTFFLVLTQLGDTLRAAYQTITDLMVIAGMAPFVYIFAAAWLCGGRWSVVCGLGVTAISLIVSVLPTADVHSVWLFEAKLLGVTAILVLSGRLLYNRNRHRARLE